MDPYIPQNLPIRDLNWEAFIPLIGKANARVGKFDGLIQRMNNPELLLAPLSTREAVLSSKIEGTQASLEDVLLYEASLGEALHREEESKTLAHTESQKDIQEIINYRNAMLFAINDLKTRPLSIASIQDIHRILLTSVRGQDKEAGEIRKIQNYIAPTGTPIERATFIPPSPPAIKGALSNWESYLHSEEKDPLVQLAVLKAQFELIHPFRDGNGRVGRMLVPLIMYTNGVLSTPMFYISAYLEENRDLYYKRLLSISRDNDWNGWIAFFLQAVIAQADENIEKVTATFSLYNEMKEEVPKIIRSQYAVQAIDALFSRQVFSSTDYVKISKIPKDAAHRTLTQLKDADIIRITREGGGRRPTIYEFPRLMAITGDILQ